MPNNRQLVAGLAEGAQRNARWARLRSFLRAGAAATAALAPSRLVPAAARTPDFRKSRRAGIVQSSPTWPGPPQRVVVAPSPPCQRPRYPAIVSGTTVRSDWPTSQWFGDPHPDCLGSGNALSAWLYSLGSEPSQPGVPPRRLCQTNRQMSAAVAAAVSSAVGGRAAAADADQAKLQGKWLVESFDYNGNPVDVMNGASANSRTASTRSSRKRRRDQRRGEGTRFDQEAQDHRSGDQRPDAARASTSSTATRSSSATT